MRIRGVLKTALLSCGVATAPVADTSNDELERWLNYERPAEYEALVTAVRPVMRDGAELDCKMAVPAVNGQPAEGTFPGVINNFNPYALLEVFFVGQIEELATLGYQGLTCRVRGSGDSDGEFSYIGEETDWSDSYDLVEWLASQQGSNGRVAFEGASYGGMTSLQAAVRKPPHLVTVVPLVPASDLYLDLIYRGGVKSRPYTSGNWPILTSLMNFPSMSPWRIWDNWYAHLTLDEFWTNAMPIHWAEQIDIPMLIAPGWADDLLPNGGIRLYEKMLKLGKGDKTWMYVGSWDHDMATFPRNVVIAWLDHWLQQRADAPLPPARVVSYVMGAEQPEHKHLSDWPPANHETLQFALSQNGSLATAVGAAGERAFEQHAYSGLIGSPDTLVFTSEALTEAIEIAGDIELDLVASFDADDAKLHIQALEIRGEETRLIKEAWFNMQHRNSHEQAEPIPVGETIKTTINVGAIHWRVAKGSQLVLKVSGVDTWDWTPVSNTVNTTVLTGEGGSSLRLPLVKTFN